MITCERKIGFEYIPFKIKTYKSKRDEIRHRIEDKAYIQDIIHNVKHKYNSLSKSTGLRFSMITLNDHIEVEWEEVDQDDISLLIEEQQKRLCRKYNY